MLGGQYDGSPTTGWPIASRCTRIWWVRPVPSVTSSSVVVGSSSAIWKCVTACRGAVPSTAIRPLPRSRPMAASMRPARAGGPAVDERGVLRA